MAFRTRVAVGLVAVAALILLVVAYERGSSDAGSVSTREDGGSAAATSGEMLVLMTDDRCIYQGGPPPATGLFAVQVENHTVRDGHFVLGKMVEDAARSDAMTFVEAMRRQLTHGGRGPLHIPPPWMQPVSDTSVAAGALSALPANNGPGRYVVLCVQERSPGVIHKLGAVILPQR